MMEETIFENKISSETAAIPAGEKPSWKKRLRERVLQHRVELLLFILIFTTYAYFYQSTMQNEAARLDQTRAMFENGTLLINKYWWNSADVIHLNANGTDRIFPAKAPGASFLALPAYAFFSITLKLLRLVGVPEWIYWHAVAYFTILFTIGLLSAMAAWLTFRLLEFVTGDTYFSALTIIAIWLGTLQFPFSTVYFGHAACAAFLAIAFYLMFQLRITENPKWKPTWQKWLLAGFLMGFSVTTEYPTAILAILLGLYGLWVVWRTKFETKQKLILLGFWLLGGVIGGGFLIGYNLAAFGKPFYLAYEALARPDSAFPMHSHGWVGFQLPGWKNFFHAVNSFMVVPPVGLLYVGFSRWWIYGCNPVLWLALPGLVMLIWHRAWRAEGILILAMLVAYIVFISCYGTSIYDWAGATYIGPRHIIPFLPFLALPLFYGGRLLRYAFYPLLAISVFYMLLCTAVEPRVPYVHEIPERDLLLPDYLKGKLAQNTLNLFDSANRNLTNDSTAFNLAKLVRFPGQYQLAPLMLWWLVAGGALLFLAYQATPLRLAPSVGGISERPPPPAGSEPPPGPRYSPKAATIVLFFFVSAIAIAPIIRYVAKGNLHQKHGLLGKYYRTVNWTGQPTDVQIDPKVDFDWALTWPLPAPFSVEWSGNLIVDHDGQYVFTLNADDGAVADIDGMTVVDVTNGPMLRDKDGSVALTAGLHHVRVRYFNSLSGGSVHFYWTVPGRSREVVPTDAFVPDQPGEPNK